ncbi:MAG: 3-phosphoshikimate 1-carboxyvinyltransferase [Chitinophagaceae bacterium]|nr:3-phosphoshikimate 1-carboxyvinyltransferase [Chitinophagaceae bacterium]
MTATIQPSVISGTITAPASKSSMQRACAAALLYKGKTILRNPGNSNDDLASIEIIEALGALVEPVFDYLEIVSDGVEPIVRDINCRESGLAIRMFTPIIALSDKKITIKGEGSLRNRPMNFFDEVLPQLAVNFKSTDGKLPLITEGPLIPANIEIDGSLSSQFITGLLMAFSAANAKNVSIRVNNLKSKPYIDLTLHVMNQFGMKLPENRNYDEFYFSAGDMNYGPDSNRKKTIEYAVEGDWSNASFLLIAGAVAGGITVNGLDLYSTQADKEILKALMDSGVNISIEEKQVTVNAPLGQNGKAFHFNATDCPDLFPPLVVLAAYCQGTTVIEGVARLLHKESNRALTLQQEFKKIGINITLQDDLMMIEGGGELKGAPVHAHHDHRIAMACAVAALGAAGEMVIENAEAVNKSYPGFYDDLKLLGANVSLEAIKS